MKKTYLFAVIALLLTFKSEAKKIKGRIIFENDTINVTFGIPFNPFTLSIDYKRLQQGVMYYDSTGEEKVLWPENAKEIQFEYHDENIRMLSRHNSLKLINRNHKSTNIFLKLELDGYLKLFFYHSSINELYGYANGEGKYILQKGEEELKRPKELAFKKDMVEYFNECPNLVEKIESNYFIINDLFDLVVYYNLNCKN